MIYMISGMTCFAIQYYVPLRLKEAQRQRVTDAINRLKIFIETKVSKKAWTIPTKVVGQNFWLALLILSVVGKEPRRGDLDHIVAGLGLPVLLSSAIWLAQTLATDALSNRVTRPPVPLLEMDPLVPKRFHNDRFLNRFICPITLQPIRNLVEDSRGVHYERDAIIAWINLGRPSPVTSRYVTSGELTQRSGINALIACRIRLLEEQEKKLNENNT